MKTLEQYVSENYPKISEEFKRLTTPFYYEPNVIYNPIRSGFGCDSNGSTKPLIIVNGDYYKSGAIQIKLKELNGDSTYTVSKNELHTSLKRADESVEPQGLTIPNSKKIIYKLIDGKEYVIWQTYFRDYTTKKLGGRLIVKCDQWKNFLAWGSKYDEYVELYSYIGNSSWTMKHVYSYDSVGREQDTITHNVSVRKFKEKVFGDPNVKLICDLFDSFK